MKTIYKTILNSIVWGLSIILISQLLKIIPPMTLIFLRFFLAFVAISLLIFIKKIPLKNLKIENKELLSCVIKGGFLYFIYSILYHFAATELSILTISAYCAMTPIFMLIVTNFHNGKVVSFRECVVIAGAALGAVTMIDVINIGQNWVLHILIISAILIWCIYCLNTNKHKIKSTSSNLVVGFYETLFVLLFSLPFALAETTTIVRLSYMEVFYLLFISIICIANVYINDEFYVNLSEYYDIGLYYCLATIITFIFNMILTHTVPNIWGYGGIVISSATIAYVFYCKKKYKIKLDIDYK